MDPFTYKNKVYTECTDIGSIGPFGSKSWCSTPPNYEEDTLWGKFIEIPQIKIPKNNFLSKKKFLSKKNNFFPTKKKFCQKKKKKKLVPKNEFFP